MRKLLPELVEIMEKKVPYASALADYYRGLTIKKDKQGVYVNEIPSITGVVLGAFNGEFFHETATTHCTPHNLRQNVAELLDTITVKDTNISIDPGEGGYKEFYTKTLQSPMQVELSEKIEILKEIENKLIKLDSRVINAWVAYKEQIKDQIFVNRNKNFTQTIIRVNVILSLFMSDGNKVVNNMEILGKTKGVEILKEIDENLLEKIKKETIEMLKAEKIKPGFYNVITCPDVTGIIAHETFGHGVEMDLYLKDGALAKDYIGSKLAPEYVNIVDDPTLEGEYGCYFFDDEGELAKPTYIIENGIFKRGISDLYSSIYLSHLPRSANGRRESIARKPYARMSNTFFVPGKHTVEEIIESTDYGIYMDNGYFGMEDPKGWGMQINSRIGREIKGGKFTGKVFSPITMTGFVPDILKEISHVGNIFLTIPGTCAKRYKEDVLVAIGGAHLKTKARLG
ncbi:MAG TPA: TldD/PmbA family protein [Candidatus Eremiobacteraeota bacterium]|nr:MAG: protease TldD [bacterium ADurb.Bin363]HPZ09825.1 TldD/PmbA family protein [Candidatus Eremiobacteraeota bacterium]